MKTIKHLFLGGIILLSTIKVKAQIPNPSFEQWQTRNFGIKQFQDPNNWITNNIVFAFTSTGALPIKKTTDSRTGSFAIELENVPDTSEQKTGASITSGTMNILTQEFNPKFKINAKPSSLNLYYKYYPAGNDSFFVQITIMKNGEFLGAGNYTGGGKNEDYSKLSIPIQYEVENQMPDSASIFIYSSGFGNVTEGTRLILDDLSFTNAPLSVNHLSINNSINVYPNPAQNQLNIDLEFNQARLNIFAINGKSMQTNTLEKGNNTIDVSALENGIYLVQIISDKGVSNHKININK